MWCSPCLQAFLGSTCEGSKVTGPRHHTQPPLQCTFCFLWPVLSVMLSAVIDFPISNVSVVFLGLSGRRVAPAAEIHAGAAGRTGKITTNTDSIVSGERPPAPKRSSSVWVRLKLVKHIRKVRRHQSRTPSSGKNEMIS